MKKLGRILLISLCLLVVLFAVAVTLTVGWRPFLGPKARPLTARKFESTPVRLERGHYLYTSLLGCTDCHSQHNWAERGDPVIPGTEAGGQFLDMPDLPGHIVAPNITPDLETGSGGWSDDQLARAIREGVGHDGHTLFPMMPYQMFRKMSDEDLASIIVYLRTLPPIRHKWEPTEIAFPVKYLIRNAPEPVTEPVSSPNPSDKVKYGEYLVTIAACAGCHTPQDKGAPIPGMEFAGGWLMRGPWGAVAAANITSDASGISYYDEAQFIQTLRTGYVKARALNTIMPYGIFKNLTDDDLKAIFAYIQTIKAVHHRVDNSLPPTYCKLCKQKHGAGDQNYAIY